MMEVDAFSMRGFAMVPGVVSAQECEWLAAQARPAQATVGVRSLLQSAWCAELAERIRSHPGLSGLIGESNVAVQCTYFEKSRAMNWRVPLHQDLSIPVAERVEGRLTGWSDKDGMVFVHAPASVLPQLAAVRLHLDACDGVDGPLRVVPGSHRAGILDPAAMAAAREAEPEVECTVDCGGALVLRPLLLHGSSKSTGAGRRRVLHFLFGPRELPYGLRWQHCV